MKKRQLFILGLVISLTSTINSQTRVEVPTEVFRNELRDGTGGLPLNYEGSPYLDETFRPGKILMKNSNEYSQGMLRYNAYRDQVELKDGDNFTVILKRPYIEAEILGQNFSIKKYIDEKGTVADAYFIVLNKGKYQLFERITKIFYPPEDNLSSTYKKAKPARFVDQKEYYLSIDNQPAEKIKLRKKAILEKIDINEAEQILKNNNLKLKNTDEILKFFDLIQ